MATVTVVFGGQEQKVYQLDKPKLIVGREPTCEIPIDNLGISRQHCQFALRGEAFIVQDLGSSNGTFVNGKKITEHFLNNDDEVVIGKYTLKFKNDQQAAPAAAPGAGSANVPDTLNTYVMDGAKIQEQLAKMRQGAGASGSGTAPAAPGVGATAKDYAKALDPTAGAAPTGEVAAMKTYMIALAAVVIVLLVVVAILFVKLSK